jgi:hypothetical protein
MISLSLVIRRQRPFRPGGTRTGGRPALQFSLAAATQSPLRAGRSRSTLPKVNPKGRGENDHTAASPQEARRLDGPEATTMGLSPLRLGLDNAGSATEVRDVRLP